ncbi:MAG: transporter substrate-binding domain-containing protein [Acidobacteriota bacterium]
MSSHRLELQHHLNRRPLRRVLLGMALVTVATATVTPASAGDLAEIRARGKLVMLCFANVGSSSVRPNLDIMREKGLTLAQLHSPDQFEGFDVDLMKSFAASLGLPLEIHSVTTSYAELIPALVAGEGDVVATSFTITEDRKKVIDFSEPYQRGWIVVAVPLDSKVQSLADLAGKRGLAMRGSSQAEIFQRLQVPNTKLEFTDFTAQSYSSVLDGKADYLLTDSAGPLGSPPVPTYPLVKVAVRLSPYDYGFAVRPGSDLRTALDQWLAGIKASGELQSLATRNHVEMAKD